jgi:hypothetical protein
MRKAILAILTLSALATAFAAPLWAAEETEHKYGFNPESFEVKFYIQPRYTFDGTSGEPLQVDADNWFGVRRARIYLTSQVTPNIKGRIHFGTRPTGFKPLDIYLDWKFMEIAQKRSVSFRVGQFKKPFSYQEFVMSSSKLNMLDRTFNNAFLAAGVHASERDQGAMLTADLREYDIPSQIYLSVFNGNGPGKSVDDNNGKQFVGRADLTPLSGLTVAGDLSINRMGSTSDTLGTDPEDPYGAFTALVWGGELVYSREGFQLVSEVFGGDNTERINDFRMQVPTFLGWYAEAIYRTTSGWEPGFRYESFDPNTDADNDGRSSYRGVLGWSLSKNFRWQVEYAISDFEADRENLKIFISQWTVRL